MVRHLVDKSSASSSIPEEMKTQTTGESTPPAQSARLLHKRKYNLVSPVITVSCMDRESERKREIMLRKHQHSPEEFQELSYYKPHKKKRKLWSSYK